MNVDQWLATVTWNVRSSALQDAGEARHTLGEVTANLHQVFLPVGGTHLLSSLRLSVDLHAGEADESSMDTNRVGTSSTAMLTLCGPSHLRGMTITGEPKDASYYFKTLLHEVSMLFLWQTTVHKTAGWSFFGAPNWFSDGWEEY